MSLLDLSTFEAVTDVIVSPLSTVSADLLDVIRLFPVLASALLGRFCPATVLLKRIFPNSATMFSPPSDLFHHKHCPSTVRHAGVMALSFSPGFWYLWVSHSSGVITLSFSLGFWYLWVSHCSGVMTLLFPLGFWYLWVNHWSCPCPPYSYNQLQKYPGIPREWLNEPPKSENFLEHLIAFNKVDRDFSGSPVRPILVKAMIFLGQETGRLISEKYARVCLFASKEENWTNEKKNKRNCLYCL